jgi:molybdopterin-guanine dinucleotide biosynthesis adapter protein
MHERRDRPEASPAELLQRMTPVDLMLIEGLKGARHDKLEHRPARGKPVLCRDDPHVVAVASDGPVPEIPVPLLCLDDTAAIAAFIVRHCGLEGG